MKLIQHDTSREAAGGAVSPLAGRPAHSPRLWMALLRRAVLGTAAVAAISLAPGCASGPTILPAGKQTVIDRKDVEYPTGFELKLYAKNLNAPAGFAFDTDETMLVAESGAGGDDPRIFGWRKDGKFVLLYPTETRFPLAQGFRIYGPVGGIAADHGNVYVTHRDSRGRGAVTRFRYDGSHTTIVADLPAQGDYSVTDVAISPPDGRLFFGLGSATNSGVVGLDNLRWVRKHPDFCDLPGARLKLNGFRFTSPNPFADIFQGNDIATTGPYQPFGRSLRARVEKAADDKPTSAIYSVTPTGGDLRVEAFGIRNPRGLAFNEFNRLYFTNQGMEMRGTRPVKNDPDALLVWVPGSHYGFPDYSTTLEPISRKKFQPPPALLLKFGYQENSRVIDDRREIDDSKDSGSQLPPLPSPEAAVMGEFLPLSGAAKLAFAPDSGAFAKFHGDAIVALAGDRAPLSTSGMKLVGPLGYKVMRVTYGHQVEEFVHNTRGLPASRVGPRAEGLERPIDVKFGPDGAMYILDFGRMDIKFGKERFFSNTGRIYKLVGVAEKPTTQP